MTSYLLFLILLILFFMLKGRYVINHIDYIDNQYLQNKTKSDMFFFVIVLVLLMAFRSVTVGIDTIAYYRTYLYRDFSSWILSRIDLFKSELGFQYLQLFLNKMGIGFQGLTFIEALVYVVPVVTVIHKYSKNPYYSLFIFFAFDYYLFGMTAIRQTIAMGIVMIAFIMAIRKKIFHFIIFIFLASLFHITAVISFPIYFLSMLPFKKKYIFAAIVLGIFIYFSQATLQTWMKGFARINYDDKNTGGLGMYFFFLSMLLVDLLLRKNDKNSLTEADILVRYMMIISIIIYPLLRFHPAIFRLHFYYSIVVIIYLPNILRTICYPNICLSLKIGYTIIALYYMFSYTFNQLGAVPYTFFWQ